MALQFDFRKNILYPYKVMHKKPSFIKKHPLLIGLVISFLTPFLCLFILEIFLRINKEFNWIKNTKRTYYIETYSPNFDKKEFDRIRAIMKPKIKKFVDYPTKDRDSELKLEGFDRREEHPPKLQWISEINKNLNYISIVRSKKTKTLIYKVRISTDKYISRTVIGRPPHAKKQIIFSGCSYTYGVGLNDENTYPYYLQKLNPKVQIYNTGMEGWSAARILYELQYEFKERYKKIPIADGTFVYMFINDHLKRALCPLSCYDQETYWMTNSPNYELNADPNKEVIMKGLFTQREPLHQIYSFLSQFQVVPFLGIDWPPLTSNNSLDKFVAIVNSLKKEVERKLKIKNFYFAFYPVSSSLASPALDKKLERAGIQILDLRPPNVEGIIGADRTNIPGDGHPTALVQELTAIMLHEKLK